MYRIAVVGYGNLGKAIEAVAANFPDLCLKYIFTRRNPEKIGARILAPLPYSSILEYKGALDCLILAGGSRSDLPLATPYLAAHFNLVDSYDIHKRIPSHKKRADSAARGAGKLAMTSSGWDPGLLSLMRLYLGSFMPYARQTTIWGRGVSQGHSEAIRSIDGVRLACELTEPKAYARLLALSGIKQNNREIHKRICYVVAESGYESYIEEKIRNMPEYFDGYQTEIHFISEDEFLAGHSGLPHRGEIISVGYTSDSKHRARADFSIDMASNPEFTANILLASARAVCRLNEEGKCGAVDIFDIPPRYFGIGKNLL